MRNFRIVPLSVEYVNRVRSAGKDLFGNSIQEELARGYGPCRLSLKPFVPGKDRRLLFSHSPFDIQNAFNQPGPVFINKEAVEPYADIYRFPPEIKADKKHFPLTLIGYSSDQRMLYTKLVKDADIDEMIEQVLNKSPDIAFLHARNAEAGCFICKIGRI